MKVKPKKAKKQLAKKKRKSSPLDDIAKVAKGIPMDPAWCN